MTPPPTETMRLLTRAREALDRHVVWFTGDPSFVWKCKLCEATWNYSMKAEMKHTPDCIISQLDAALAAPPANVEKMRAALEAIHNGIHIPHPGSDGWFAKSTARAALDATGEAGGGWREALSKSTSGHKLECATAADPRGIVIYFDSEAAAEDALMAMGQLSAPLAALAPLPTPPAEGGRDE